MSCAPPALAQRAGDLFLSLSRGIGEVALRPMPVFREEDGAGLNLFAAARLGIIPITPVPVGKREPPFPQAPLPLQLFQALGIRSADGKWFREEPWGAAPVSPPALNKRFAGDVGEPGPPIGGRRTARAPEQARAEPDADIDEPVMAASRKSGATVPPPPLPVEEEPVSRGPRWGIPPIRWGGSLGYNLRRSSSTDGPVGLDQYMNGGIHGGSYFYAPWLARVSGDLGIFTGVSKIQGQDSGNDQSSRATGLTGGAVLDLFPVSRFPLSATFSRSDSRTASAVTTTDYTNTRFGLRQSYNPEDSRDRYLAAFDHSTVRTRGGGGDTVNSLTGTYSAPIGAWNNNVNARASVSEREGSGEGTTLFSLNSSHSTVVNEDMSLQAYSNFTDNTLRYNSGGLAGTFRGQYLQLGTSGSWRPEFEDFDEQPLTLGGGLSYFGARSGGGDSSGQSQSLSGNVSGSYMYSRNVSITGSGSVSHSSSSGSPSLLIYSASSGISYAGDPLTIGKFSYNWGSGGSLSWQGSSRGGPSNAFASATVNHSLSRYLPLSSGDSASISFSQGVTTYGNQRSGGASSLSNSASTAYQFRAGDQFSGGVTVNFSDTFSTGAASQHYDSLNVGFNGFGQLNSRSSASVNLSFYWSSQNTKNALDNGQGSSNVQRMGLSGSASYSHSRFAGVPGLRYTFVFSASSNLRDERMFGDANGSAARVPYSVDNRLDYHIGRLTLGASASMSDTGDGKKNALLFFQVARQIGYF